MYEEGKGLGFVASLMEVGQNGPKSSGDGEIGVHTTINCKQAAHHVMSLGSPPPPPRFKSNHETWFYNWNTIAKGQFPH
jgi:hypothetical protein